MRVKYLAGKIAGNFRGIFLAFFRGAYRDGGQLQQTGRQAASQKQSTGGRPQGDQRTAGAAATMAARLQPSGSTARQGHGLQAIGHSRTASRGTASG